VPTVPRTVRVVTAGGAPVAGAKVQLVDPCGEAWNDEVPVLSFSGSSFSTGPQALQLAVATTDAAGECTLPVPADRPLALMLPGPGHVPLAVPQAVFATDAPLVVTVGRGAVLRGTLGPAAAWAELLRLAGADGSPGGTNADRWLPSVWLRRGEGAAGERFPDFRTRRAVRANGTFELDGVPPGRWQAFVDYHVRQPDGSSGRQEALGPVELVDGQVATITPDLSGLLPGTLEALVLHDGAPLANTLVNFSRVVADSAWPVHEDAATTDDVGRVRLALRGGAYVATWLPPRGGGTPAVLRSVETAIVRAGEATRATLTILSGTVRVRLLDAGGAPVAGVHVGLTDAAGAETQGLGKTDADGRVEQRLSPGTFTATVLPRRLQDPKALQDFYRANPDPMAMQRVRVPVGAITVTPGAAADFELRLPADW
jgi:5-hydroxyisourate hydrolase-like protein (transthyretin family)